MPSFGAKFVVGWGRGGRIIIGELSAYAILGDLFLNLADNIAK